MKIEDLIRKTFAKLSADDFYGCQEGDCSGKYEDGVEEFIKIFNKLEKEKKR